MTYGCVGGLSNFGSRKTSEETTAGMKVQDEGDTNQRGIREEDTPRRKPVTNMLL